MELLFVFIFCFALCFNGVFCKKECPAQNLDIRFYHRLCHNLSFHRLPAGKPAGCHDVGQPVELVLYALPFRFDVCRSLGPSICGCTASPCGRFCSEEPKMKRMRTKSIPTNNYHKFRFFANWRPKPFNHCQKPEAYAGLSETRGWGGIIFILPSQLCG